MLKRVENHIQPNGVSVVMWNCKCDCGNNVIVCGSSLKRGSTMSCGCYHKECAKYQGEKNKKFNTYDLSGEHGIGYTTKGEEFYFDLEDYDKIKNYCWRIDKNSGYVMTTDHGNNKIRMHRLIMNANENVEVDHIKHKRNDNRKSELRLVSGTQNSMNRSLQSNNTSGVTGVWWSSKHERWNAEIMLNQKTIYLGTFIKFGDAVTARKQAEEKYFGEYSYDNSMNLRQIKEGD